MTHPNQNKDDVIELISDFRTDEERAWLDKTLQATITHEPTDPHYIRKRALKALTITTGIWACLILTIAVLIVGCQLFGIVPVAVAGAGAVLFAFIFFAVYVQGIAE